MDAAVPPSCVADRVEVAHGNLIGWFVKRGLSRSDAEELAQEAWIRLVRAEQRGQTCTWPYLWGAVAPNLLRDHHRRLAAYGGARRKIASLDQMREAHGDRLRVLAKAA